MSERVESLTNEEAKQQERDNAIPVSQLILFNVQAVLNRCPVTDQQKQQAVDEIEWYVTHTFQPAQLKWARANGYPY